MVVLRRSGIPLHKLTLEIRRKLRVGHKVQVLEDGFGVCIGKACGAGIAVSDAVRGSHEQAGHVGDQVLGEIFGTAVSARQTVPSSAGLASYAESARSAMSAALQ